MVPGSGCKAQRIWSQSMMEGAAHTAAKDEQVAAVGERDSGVARARRRRLARHVRRVLAPLPAAHLQRVHLPPPARASALRRRPSFRGPALFDNLPIRQSFCFLKTLLEMPSACRSVPNPFQAVLAPVQLSVDKERSCMA